MAHEVAWSAAAAASLIDAIEYIARHSPSYAAALAIRVERAAASLDDFPNRGRRVAEFGDPAVRELLIGNYRLIYRVGLNRILLLAFVHQARDLSSLLDDPQ